MRYVVDKERLTNPRLGNATGIYVRAEGQDGAVGTYDIAVLTYDSLMAWLRSRGGSNEYAESVVAVLLGHQPQTLANKS